MFKSRFAGERYVLEGKGIGTRRRHLGAATRKVLYLIAIGPIVSEIRRFKCLNLDLLANGKC